MRVLLTTDPIGGVWAFTQELSRELLGEGHSVALVSFGRKLLPTQTAWCSAVKSRFADTFRYTASDIPLEWMTANQAVYNKGESLLLRVAEEFMPDLLHCNQFCYGRLPLKIPKLITAHSDVLSWGRACRSDEIQPSAWFDCYREIVQEGLECADAIAAPTLWMLDALGEGFSLPLSRHVIANGRRIPHQDDRIERKLQACSCGRLWDEAKYLAVLADVRAPFPIFIAGEVEYDNAKAPRHVGQALQMGALGEKELFALFRASSMYLITSRYEPFGLAALEAALCGCAIVAHDIPAQREVWGDAALYFRGADQLSMLLADMGEQPTLLASMQARACERATTYSAQGMAGKYLAIYAGLLSVGDVTASQLEVMVYGS